VEGPVADGGGRALRALLQQLIRSFGLLAGDTTPCGKPLAVSHAHALMVLLEHARLGRTPGQRELGTALGIDKSNVARLCRRMEKAGHLRQGHSREDGRARVLSLTPQGTRVAEAVERSSLARFAELAAAVPTAHRPSVLSALELLNRAIAASAAPADPAPAGRGPPPRRARRAGGTTP
jgi:DNA-binding MarR family transcriptional regulator